MERLQVHSRCTTTLWTIRLWPVHHRLTEKLDQSFRALQTLQWFVFSFSFLVACLHCIGSIFMQSIRLMCDKLIIISTYSVLIFIEKNMGCETLLVTGNYSEPIFLFNFPFLRNISITLDDNVTEWYSQEMKNFMKKMAGCSCRSRGRRVTRRLGPNCRHFFLFSIFDLFFRKLLYIYNQHLVAIIKTYNNVWMKLKTIFNFPNEFLQLALSFYLSSKAHTSFWILWTISKPHTSRPARKNFQ